MPIPWRREIFKDRDPAHFSALLEIDAGSTHGTVTRQGDGVHTQMIASVQLQIDGHGLFLYEDHAAHEPDSGLTGRIRGQEHANVGWILHGWRGALCFKEESGTLSRRLCLEESVAEGTLRALRNPMEIRNTLAPRRFIDET